MTALAESLTSPERVRLAELEGVIHRNLKAFVLTGRALKEIQDSRLYRETHGTFGDYVRDQFGLSYRHAYRMIDAAEVCEELANVTHGSQTKPVPLPTSERQARELKGLTADQAARVMREATERTPPGGLTASDIRITRDVLYPVSPLDDDRPKLTPLDLFPTRDPKPRSELAEKIAERDREQELAFHRQEAHAARCRTLDAAIFLAEEFAQYPDRAADLVATYQASNPANPVTVDRLSAAIHGLKLIREAWQQ